MFGLCSGSWHKALKTLGVAEVIRMPFVCYDWWSEEGLDSFRIELVTRRHH
jgi:hypothetical protein